MKKGSHYISHQFKKGSALNTKGQMDGKQAGWLAGLSLNCGFRSNQKKNTLEHIKTRFSLSLEKHVHENFKKKEYISLQCSFGI